VLFRSIVVLKESPVPEATASALVLTLPAEAAALLAGLTIPATWLKNTVTVVPAPIATGTFKLTVRLDAVTVGATNKVVMVAPTPAAMLVLAMVAGKTTPPGNTIVTSPTPAANAVSA
jgi:hypothetical protein